MTNIGNSCGDCCSNSCLLTELQLKTAYQNVDPTDVPASTNFKANVNITGDLYVKAVLSGTPTIFWVDTLNFGIYGYNSTGDQFLHIDSGTRIGIGQNAGGNNQGTHSIAIGHTAGQNSQANHSIALGSAAGHSSQGTYAVAIGDNCAHSGQGTGSIAIGADAASSSAQSYSSIAIGRQAGMDNQQHEAIAIGTASGADTQQAGAVAVGHGAGNDTQGSTATAIGFASGYITQGATATAIGAGAGQYNQGASAVAIGFQAGYNNQHANSIVLNATGAPLSSTTTSSTYIKPIRVDSSGGTTILRYNNSTGEVVTSYDNSQFDFYNYSDASILFSGAQMNSGVAIFPNGRTTLSLEKNTLYTFHFRCLFTEQSTAGSIIYQAYFNLGLNNISYLEYNVSDSDSPYYWTYNQNTSPSVDFNVNHGTNIIGNPGLIFSWSMSGSFKTGTAAGTCTMTPAIRTTNDPLQRIRWQVEKGTNVVVSRLPTVNTGGGVWT